MQKQDSHKEVEVIVQGMKSQSDFVNKLKKEPEFVLSWLSALTELEQKVVSLMFAEGKALSTKQIRNNLIMRSEHYQKECSNKSNLPYPTQLRFTFPFDNFFHIPKNSKGFHYPSFKTINEVIVNLVNLQILLERKPLSKKIKALYFLNPIIQHQIEKQRNERRKDYNEQVRFKQKLNADIIKSGSGVTLN